MQEIDEARSKITELVESFSSLTYDLFSPSTHHHWENHLSWFNREVSFDFLTYRTCHNECQCATVLRLITLT